MSDGVSSDQHFPPYPSGLRLAGRRVVVVGGGHVAQRRVPGLIAAGAEVVVVSPQVTPAIEGLADGGEITWHRRGFADDDLDETWYVIAATDDPAVNEQISAAAEARRIFCVRSDDAPKATAWTPAVGRACGCHRRRRRQPGAAQVRRDPRRHRRGAARRRDRRPARRRARAGRGARRRWPG